MDGDTATVGTEDIEYSWDAGTNTLTAEITSGDRAGTDLFQVTIDPTNGDYSVTLLENVLHEDDDSNTEDPECVGDDHLHGDRQRRTGGDRNARHQFRR